MPNGFLPAALATLLAAASAAAADSPADLVKRSYPVADLVAPWPTPAAEPPLGVFRPVAPPSAAPTLPAPPMPPVQAASWPDPRGATAAIPAGTLVPPPLPPTAFQTQAVAPPTPAGAAMPANADKLVRLVTMMVGPYSWAELGGPGTAAYDPVRHELVVRNTAAIHAEVADLLTALRKLQERTTAQVVIEARVIEVPETFFESVGWDHECRPAVRTDKPVVHLTDAQARRLLEAVQADGRATVMMAPKMMVCDGQPGVCLIGQSMVFQTGLELTAGPGGVARAPRYEAVDLGTRIAATPTVSADRRSVRMQFRYETATVGKAVPVTPVVVAGGPEAGTAAPDVLSRPAVDRQAVAVETTLPDGGTVLIVGPRVVREERFESRVPILSNVPQLGRLFVNRGIGGVEARQLVLLTARVVPSEKEGCGKCCPDAPVPAAQCPRVEKLTSPTDVLVQAVKPTGDCKSCPSLEAANLVKAYRKACADGKTEEALKLAMQALALDPQCFAGK